MTVQPTLSEAAAGFVSSAVSSLRSSSRIARAQCVVVCLIALCSLSSFIGSHRGLRQQCDGRLGDGCDGSSSRATNSVQRLLLRPGEASALRGIITTSSPRDRIKSQSDAAVSSRPPSEKSHSARSKCPRLTIFSAPTAYNVSSYSHRRALMSWLRLEPTPRVVLLGSHPSLVSIAAEFPNHVSVDDDVDVNLEGTPLLNSVLARIQAFGASAAAGSASPSSASASNPAAPSHCNLVMLVEPDVLLFNDALFAARRLASRFSSFVMLSATWDVHTFRFSLDGLPPHIHALSTANPSLSRPYSAVSRGFRSFAAAPAAAATGAFRIRWKRRSRDAMSALPWESAEAAEAAESSDGTASADRHASDPESVNEVNEQAIRDYVRQRGKLNVAAGAAVLMWNRPEVSLLPPSVTVPPFFVGRGSYLRWLVAHATAGSLSASASVEDSNDGGNSDCNATMKAKHAASELDAADEAGVPLLAARDPESRHAVDATDAVTAVRVFSALDAQREAQLAVEKRRDETVAAVLSGGPGRRSGSDARGYLSSPLARLFFPGQVPARRGLLAAAAGGKDWGGSARSSTPLGQWQPLPGRNAKSWEVYANAHMARHAGNPNREGGSLGHAPWRLAPCFEPGGESMCLMRRRRPGNCSCEHTTFASRTTGDTRPYDANWLSCGPTQDGEVDADLLRDLRSAPEGTDSILPSLEGGSDLGLEDLGMPSWKKSQNGLIPPSSVQSAQTENTNPSPAAAPASAAANGTASKKASKVSIKAKKPSLIKEDQHKGRMTSHVAFWKGMEGLPHSLEQLLSLVASEQQAVILMAASFEDREAAMNSICRLRNLGITNSILAALDARMYAYAFLQGIPVFMHRPVNQSTATAGADTATTPAATRSTPAASSSPDNADSDSTSSASSLAAVAPILMMQILQLGYSVLWADVHTVWFANPLPHLLSLSANTLAVQSMEPNMHRPANAAETIGAGLMFARPSHLSLKALDSVVAYMAAVRAEGGEEGGSVGGSVVEGGGEAGGEVEEYRAFHDVLCGENDKYKVGKDSCVWSNGFRVVFLSRQPFPSGSRQGTWDTPPSLGGLGQACKKQGCVAVQNSGVRGRMARAERLAAHGLVSYDARRRMCVREWTMEPKTEVLLRSSVRR